MSYFNEKMVKAAMVRIPYAEDWQDVQAGLLDDSRFTAWLHLMEDDRDSYVQAIIGEAEARLGDKVPY